MSQPLVLPEEIVDQILGCALTVPEQTFRAWHTPQTFAGTPSLHLYNILATSWQWYRVGVPYLYEAAILRTQAQVHGFYEAICKYHNGEKLSRYLRRLRIDGGYSSELGQILQMVGPQITELFLSFDMSADDRLKGVLKSLSRANPTRLFLDASPNMQRDVPASYTEALSNALLSTVPGWSKLKRIDVGAGHTLFNMLYECLFQLRQVEYVSCTVRPQSHEFTLGWMDIRLRPILERPTLKVLQIRNGRQWLSPSLSTWGAGLSGIRQKLFLGEGKNMVSLAAFPDMDVITPEPTLLPELPDKIWARILWIATHYDGYDPAVDDYETTVRASDADRRAALTTGLRVIRVCKRFYRIGREHLYSHSFLYRAKIEPFLLHLKRNPDLVPLVRVLYIDPRYMDLPSEARFKHFSAPLLSLVRVNSGVQVFPDLLNYAQEGAVLPLESLEQRITPPNMRTQRLAPTDMITPSMFLKLPHLRRVVLTGGRAGRLGEVDVDLPYLECLHLYEPGMGLTKLFRDMNLPRLREFGLKATSQAAVTALDFLKVHGAKLDVLTISLERDEDFKQPVLDHCPNVTELRLQTTDWVPALLPFVSHSKPHTRIERVTLPGANLDRQHPAPAFTGFGRTERVLDPLKAWRDFSQFLSEHKAKLPALAEVCVLGDFAWPVNEWQFRKCNVWKAGFVARSLHASGIALADKTGTRWCRF